MQPRFLQPTAGLMLALAASATPAQTIATGARHGLALTADGSVLAWGDNRQGQLGTGRADDAQATREIPLPAKAVAVQASSTNALVLDEQGNVWSWGTNRKGQLGDGTLADRATPQVIFRNAAHITFNGGDYGPSSLIDKDGQPWWWGPLPGDAVLARPERSGQVPARLVRLVQEGLTTAALDDQGVVWSWGPGAACAGATAPNGPVAMRDVPPIRKFVLVDSTLRGLLPSGEERTPRSIIHAEDRGGNVWKWGSESLSSSWGSPTRHYSYCPPVRSSEGGALLAPQLGPAELLQDGAVFTKVTGRKYTPAVASQALSSMGLTDRGEVWLWRDALPPAPVGAITGAVRAASGAIDASVYSSRTAGLPSSLPGQSGLLYITRDGKVHAKGSNANLHLATGRSMGTGPESSPHKLPLPGPARSVHAQATNSFALLQDGRVWAWGFGAAGPQWGATVPQPMGWYTLPTEPAQLPIPASIHQLAVAQSRWLAVDAQGRVWSSGDLGHGAPPSAPFTPTLVAQSNGMPLARSVALALSNGDDGYLNNRRYAMVLGVDGSVWTIGRMFFPLPPTLEEVTLRLNTPQKVAGLPSSIGQIAMATGANGTAYYALDASGAVWFWGQHDNGLGGRAPADVPPEQTVAMAPSLLPLPGKAVSIHGGPFAFCAVLDDGSAHCRGWAFNGHLGVRFSLHAAVKELSIGGAGQAASPLAGALQGTLHLRLADGTVWAWGQGRHGQLGNGTFANAAEPTPVNDEAGTGDLDLDPATPNVPAAKRPPFRVKTRMAGNLRTLSFHAEVFGSPGPGSGSGTTNLYAFATADLGTWIQLDEQGQWSLLGSPVPPARANVPLAGEARPVVLPILPQLSGVGLAGVRIFVGQGRDAQEMLQAQRFREVLELAPED